MERATIAFTAVYLKAAHGYIGFVEELPGVNSQGRTIDEARDNLQRLARIVFDEERAQAEELLRGKEVVREEFRIPLRSRSPVEAMNPSTLSLSDNLIRITPLPGPER